MSYREYVIAAYAIFVAVLLWDYVVPKLQIRQRLRTARLRVPRPSQPSSPSPLSRE